MAWNLLSGDPRLGPLAGQGYGGPLAPGGWSPDFSEADPAPLNLTPRNPMAVNYLEALHQALPEAAARYRASQFQLGTPQPGLIHDVGYGYGGPVGGVVADMLQPPRTGEEAALMFGMPALGAIKAYHGSPHDFDRFDMSKIGTGEGAQVYGHGLYFAENPAVAESYKQLERPDWFVDGQKVATYGETGNSPIGSAAARLHQAKGADGVVTKADIETAAVRFNDLLTRNKGMYRPQEVADITDAMRSLEGKTVTKSGGKSYEVSINAEPEHFLDWDKPLSEQPPHVLEAMGKAGWQVPKSFDTSGLAEKAKQAGPDSWYAQQKAALDSMGARPTGDFVPKNAADMEALRAAGIKGIRYKDAGSRVNPPHPTQVPNRPPHSGMMWKTDDGEMFSSQDAANAHHKSLMDKGTNNYVVFDDKIIDILKKYGLAGLTGGAAATGILAGQQQRPGT